MPVLTSPEIAAKFKAKWMTLHPEDKDNVSGYVHLDDSLTSLQWLQDFSIRSANLEKPPGSGSHTQHPLRHRHRSPQGTDSPASPPAGDTAATGMPRSLGSPITSSASAGTHDRSYPHPQQAIGHVYHQGTAAPVSAPEELDYKTNRRVKPPYSYATLICMAMQASQKSKITLSAIYNWITENFCYYKHAEPSWQNSIRHNLSLNKCFMKVPRQKDEPGKGGFWQIDPQYADMFVDGVFKRRRMPSAHYSAQRQGPEASGRRQSVTNPQAAFGGPYPGPGLANKRKQPSPRRSSKGARGYKSPLLAAEAKETAVLKGDFHWASTFDEGPGGKDSNFEDLDINMALSSLGCELELSLQGRHPVVGGRWCSNGAEHACGYMEVSSADDPQPLLHPQHMEEFTLFLDQSPHPWEELKEEVQATPLSLEHSFSFCEGFFSEMQPWDRGESYL